MIKKFLINAIFLSIGVPSFGSVSMPQDLSKDCLNFIASLPQEVKFGWVQVPENWDNPQGSPQLSIFYYTDYSIGKIPLLYLSGGPLGHVHSARKNLLPFSQNRKLGLIFADFRGGGCSTLLPAQPTDETLNRASFYGSENIARDFAVVRQHLLGNQKWSIFGNAFGATVMNRLVIQQPEKIQSIHYYGGFVFDSSSEFYFMRNKSQYDILATIEQMYPGTKAGLSLLRQQLDKSSNKSDCVEVKSRQFCGSVLVDALFLYLNGLPSQIYRDILAPILKNPDKFDIEFLKAKAKVTFEYYLDGRYPHIHSAFREDFASINNNRVLKDDCLSSYPSLKSLGINVGDLSISECGVVGIVFDDSFMKLTVGNFAKRPVRNQITKEDLIYSLAQNSEIGVYIYSGGFDGFMSYDWAFDLSSRLPQSQHRHFPGLDHFGYFKEESIWDRITEGHNRIAKPLSISHSTILSSK